MDGSQKGCCKNLQPEKGRTEQQEAEDINPTQSQKSLLRTFPDVSQMSDADGHSSSWDGWCHR